MSNYTTVTLKKATYNKLADFTRETKATNSDAVEKLLSFYWKKRKLEADRIMEEFWAGLKELNIKKKLKSSDLDVVNAYL